MEKIITKYFKKGYRYKEILEFLEEHHSIKISLRTLKNKLKSYGLRKRNLYSNEHVSDVINRVSDELQGSGSLYGYRAMWRKLCMSGLTTSRDLVMMTLRELDPEGVSLRKAKRLKRRNYTSPGPNDTWHADGYDKLKQFGFPIHGCIDGFSQRLLWLRYVKSNNNPS